MNIKKEELSARVTADGYTLLFRGHPIGGAMAARTGVFRHAAHKRADIKEYRESADRKIEALVAGRGDAYMRKAIEAIFKSASTRFNHAFSIAFSRENAPDGKDEFDVGFSLESYFANANDVSAEELLAGLEARLNYLRRHASEAVEAFGYLIDGAAEIPPAELLAALAARLNYLRQHPDEVVAACRYSDSYEFDVNEKQKMDQEVMRSLQERGELQRRAQAAFEAYEFDGGIEIIGTGNWSADKIDGELDYTRVAYANYSEDGADEPSHKISFHARFDATCELVEVYALDMKTGNELGRRGDLVAAETPLPGMA